MDEASDLVLENVDYSKEAKEVCESFESIVKADEKSLDVHIDDGIIVKAEKKSLHTLVNILVDNAVKYSAGGDVLVTLERKLSFVELTVMDNGPGIPETYLPTLFDPFVTHKNGGTGLGLNIVKNITELHHGTVTVTTSCIPGHSGTDFCISIPRILSSEVFVQTALQV